jgi:hypothetical protein
MRSTLYATFLLSFLNLTLATSNHPRIFRRGDICYENDQVDCDSSCMPADANCCNDGSGTYCPSGEYCDIDGCCPEGELCSGGGGTATIDNLTGTGSFPTGTPISTENPVPTGAAPTGLSHGSQLYALALVAAGQLALG